MLLRSNPVKWQSIDGNFRPAFRGAEEVGLQFRSSRIWNCFDGARGMSRKSMRSKVEARLIKESGKTLRERRRASKLRKKLMTEEERLLYNLRRVCFNLHF